jgi:hypothetical protein
VSLSEVALAGGWQLVAYHDVDESGATSEGPLGAAPQGLLLYSRRGYMSVSMMRAEPVAGADGFMGYAGQWQLSGHQVIHEVVVSSHPHMVRTRQVRDVALADDLLTLRGTSLLEGRPRQRLLTWRRLAQPHRFKEEI